LPVPSPPSKVMNFPRMPYLDGLNPTAVQADKTDRAGHGGACRADISAKWNRRHQRRER
jgi:hypothetical protein